MIILFLMRFLWKKIINNYKYNYLKEFMYIYTLGLSVDDYLLIKIKTHNDIFYKFRPPVQPVKEPIIF